MEAWMYWVKVYYVTIVLNILLIVSQVQWKLKYN